MRHKRYRPYPNADVFRRGDERFTAELKNQDRRAPRRPLSHITNDEMNDVPDINMESVVSHHSCPSEYDSEGVLWAQEPRRLKWIAQNLQESNGNDIQWIRV